MEIILGILGFCVFINLLINVPIWIKNAISDYKTREKERALKRKIDEISARSEEEFKKKYYRTNVLVLKEDLYHNKAYFKGETVYAVSEYGDFIIGYFDKDGKVYSSDRLEIGSITNSGDCDELIQLHRLGDLKHYRQLMYNKTDETQLSEAEKEEYYPLARNTNIAWMCARVWSSGTVDDLKSGEEIGKREVSVGESESNAIGYGACFVCLQYLTSNHGKYADFYCPLGKKYEV